MNAFKRLEVQQVVEGGTRIEWQLDARFLDPLPHHFQLQVAKTSAPNADDWANVGLEATNAYFLTDGEKRIYGKSLETHYRVVLRTHQGIYRSDSASAVSKLTHREWRLARELVRGERKRLEKYTGTEGYLLKRRRFGPPCSGCLDTLTQEEKTSDCLECYGTGILGGYYRPTRLYIEMNPEQTREHVDKLGTVKPVAVAGKAISFPLFNSKDVFVEKNSDRRWFVQTVAEMAKINGYPIVSSLQLQLAPFSDLIYAYPVSS